MVTHSTMQKPRFTYRQHAATRLSHSFDDPVPQQANHIPARPTEERFLAIINVISLADYLAHRLASIQRYTSSLFYPYVVQRDVSPATHNLARTILSRDVSLQQARKRHLPNFSFFLPVFFICLRAGKACVCSKMSDNRNRRHCISS